MPGLACRFVRFLYTRTLGMCRVVPGRAGQALWTARPMPGGRVGPTPMYVPYSLLPHLFQFLRREVNKAFPEVTEEKENRGTGYGLEIPYVYRLYRAKVYTLMKQLLKYLRTATCIATHIIM